MKISNWWNKNMNDKMLPTFLNWVEDFNAQSKKMVRNYIISKNYKSILDIGCGLCDTYYGYKNDNYNIEYTGLDNCKYFVDKAKDQNINIIDSDMIKINVPDNSYDVVYGRHILEHLPTYKISLNEFIRIAKFEVIIIFFIKPDDNLEEIRYTDDNDLYHNKYSKNDIENNLINYEYNWIDVNKKEIILYIKK